MTDIYKILGLKAFGSRVKKLSDALNEDITKLYSQLEIEFEPRFFVLTNLLMLKPNLTISEIAKELNISQPAASQLTEIMLKKGLIKIEKSNNDTRKKFISLTPKCRKLAEQLTPLWNDVQLSLKDIFDEVGIDLLSVLDNFEAQFEKNSISQRVLGKTKLKMQDEIEILDYSPAYKNDFKKLNYEWLKKYFKVEKPDKEMLSDPEKYIIEPGGSIFFAKYGGKIVGTGALIKTDTHTFELSKIAVTEKMQGKQIGYKLGKATIEKAKENKANKITLETSTNLVSAISLYKKLGFRQVDFNTNNNSKFERTSFKMELNL